MVYVVIHEVEYLDKYLMIKHTMLNIFKSIKNDAFFFRNLDVIINLTWKKPNSKCAYISYCALCNLYKSKLNYFASLFIRGSAHKSTSTHNRKVLHENIFRL